MMIESSFELSSSAFSLDGGSFVTVLGVLDCVLLCMKTRNCSSIFYSHSIRSCALSPRLYQKTTGLTPQAGTSCYNKRCEFGMKCSSTANCRFPNSVCLEGSCQCAVGYSYKAAICSCVMRCNVYGNDFAVYPENGICGCNLVSLTTRGVADCLQACRDTTSFFCITAEYKESNGRCYLCDKAWFDLEKDKREYNNPPWDVYQRNCA